MTRPDHEHSGAAEAECFDRAMRSLHAQALAHTSPATRLKLRGARAVSAQARRHRGLGWAGAAVAAVCVLAIGLNLDIGRSPSRAAPESSGAVAAVSDDANSFESAVTALDENPELYVWLASNEDAWLASQ